MFRAIKDALVRMWRAYSRFVEKNGLDQGNCRRCVPIIRHDPPLEKKKKEAGENDLEA